jgi:hypothetical protein
MIFLRYYAFSLSFWYACFMMSMVSWLFVFWLADILVYLWGLVCFLYVV